MEKLDSLITEKLNELDKKYTSTGNGFIMCSCLSPTHNDSNPSFSINLATGKGFCFTCDYTVSAQFFLNGLLNEEDLEEYLRRLHYTELKKSALAQADRHYNFKKEVYLPPVSEIPTSYRGLSQKTLTKAGVYIAREGKFADRMIFPVYYGSAPVGYTGRALENQQPKYLHASGFATKHVIYPYNLLRGRKKIYVCEGIMDCLSLWEEGYPAMCNFGVSDNFTMHKVAELTRLGVEQIELMFDKDEAGQVAEVRIIQNPNLRYFDKVTLSRNNKEFADYYAGPAKDYNEYLALKKLGYSIPSEPDDEYIPPDCFEG